jgi:hypothetical protein
LKINFYSVLWLYMEEYGSGSWRFKINLVGTVLDILFMNNEQLACRFVFFICIWIWSYLHLFAGSGSKACWSRSGWIFIPITGPNFHPGTWIPIKEFKKFYPKSSRNMTLVVHPGRDHGTESWFLPILDPGSRGQKCNGSRIRICITEFSNTFQTLGRISVADPGSGAFLTPGYWMGRKSASGSGMNNPDHIF